MKKFIIALCICLALVFSAMTMACDMGKPSQSSQEPTLEFTTVPNDFKVFATAEVEIPAVAHTEGAELSVIVNAPSGAAIAVNDGKFIAESDGEYVITYTIKIGKATKSQSITVTAVSSSIKPTLTVEEGTPDRILVGETLTLKNATAIDALDGALTVSVKVTDPNGAEVTVENGAFIATLRGIYNIVYTATDAIGNAAEEILAVEVYKIPEAINPVADGVKNSFETEEQSYLDRLNDETEGVTFSRIDTNDNADEVRSGAYSLKAVINSGDKINLVSEVIVGDKDLSEIGTLSFWVYNANDTKSGFSIYNVILSDKNAKVTEVYKELEVGVWTKYEINLVEKCSFTAEQLKDVYAIQLWSGATGTFYIDDIAWDNRSDY